MSQCDVTNNGMFLVPLTGDSWLQYAVIGRYRNVSCWGTALAVGSEGAL